jgi:hypothetical protein
MAILKKGMSGEAVRRLQAKLGGQTATESPQRVANQERVSPPTV